MPTIETLMLNVVRTMRTPYYDKPGVVKIEFESPEAKKQAIDRAGRLRNWTTLGYRVMIRSSQPPEMRVQGANLRTWIKGNNLESEFTVNKNCRLLPVPGSMTAANILASNERAQNARNNQGPPGNPMYPPVPPPSNNYQPYPGNGGPNFNPVYGPPRPPPPNFPFGPRPRYGPPPAPSYAAAAQPRPYSQNTGQFMSGPS